jgi:hypothetical protein
MTAEILTGGIYIASKAKHGARWVSLREQGWPICSTWIDESGEGETQDVRDLWDRCVNESASADVLILYAEPGEVMKGGLVEMGAALARGVRVLYVGPTGLLSALHHRLVSWCGEGADGLARALDAACQYARVPTSAKGST